jgi:hypothetical protein
MHYFSTLFDKALYMFWTDLLSIIRSLNTVYTAIHASYVYCLLADTNITSMITPSGCVYSVETPDDGQYVCPKHVEFFIKIKLRNSASCWFLL